MRPKEAAKAAELVNPPKVFDFSAPDMVIFGSLPKWIQDKMKAALDFAGSPLDKAIKAGPKVADEEEEKPKGKAKVKEPELEDDTIPW
jgi:hypothetical protein